MKWVARSIRETEQADPGPLPGLIGITNLLFVVSTIFYHYQQQWFYSGHLATNVTLPSLRWDIILLLASCMTGVTWLWARTRGHASPWTGSGLLIACYGLIMRSSLNVCLACLPWPHPYAGATDDFGELARVVVIAHVGSVVVVALGITLVITACVADRWERAEHRARLVRSE